MSTSLGYRRPLGRHLVFDCGCHLYIPGVPADKPKRCPYHTRAVVVLDEPQRVGPIVWGLLVENLDRRAVSDPERDTGGGKS